MATRKRPVSAASRQHEVDEPTASLPTIVIEKIEDIAMSIMHLRMPDEIHDMVTAVGKEVITVKDYFEVGFRHLLEDTMKRRGRRERKSRRRA